MENDDSEDSAIGEDPILQFENLIRNQDASREERKKRRPKPATIQRTYELLKKDQSRLSNLLEPLKLNDAFSEGKLFSIFHELQSSLGWNPETYRLTGLIWNWFYSGRDASGRFEILQQFLTSENFDFFRALDSLPEFISNTEIEASVLAPFLKKVRDRIGNDMASGGLWRALEALGTTYPDTALDIMELWLEDHPR